MTLIDKTIEEIAGTDPNDEEQRRLTREILQRFAREMVKSCVPVEKTGDGRSKAFSNDVKVVGWMRREGFNACRSETLSNLARELGE